MNLKDKTVLVFDKGLFFCVAQALAGDNGFGKVLYYTPWNGNAFPTSNDSLIGFGFDNVEKVSHWEDYIDEVDLFVFPDVGHGSLQLLLERMGKKVWGSRKGEDFEMKRWEFRTLLQELGLPVAKAEMVTGLDELYDVLDKAKDTKYVKIDATTRGDIETFSHEDMAITENILTKLAYNLGKKSSIMNFIVEDKTESIAEVGVDTYIVDGKFPDTLMYGCECKDRGWIGSVTNRKDLPKGVLNIHDTLSDEFKKVRYRGNYSDEILQGKDGKSYLIDATCRMPCPPIETAIELYANLPEIMWYGSQGILIQPEWKAKCGGQLILHSQFARTDQYTITYPEEISQWVKQLMVARLEDSTVVIPQTYINDHVGAVVAIGDSLEEVNQLLKERVAMISGYQLEVESDCLDESVEYLKD